MNRIDVSNTPTAVCRAVTVIAIVAGSWPSVSADPATYAADFAAFVEEIDKTYPFFDLKGIRKDWDGAKPTLAERASACRSDSEFLGIVRDTIQVLRDAHMTITDAKAEMPPWPVYYVPDFSLMPASGGRVVVMYANEPYSDSLKTGTEILTIDGVNAREYLEKRALEAWPTSFNSSPQRTRVFEYRMPLKGNQNDEHTITYRANDIEETLNVVCTTPVRGWPHTYNMPEGLERMSTSVLAGLLESGVGYIYMRRVDAGSPEGLRRALEDHPSETGWIVDLRGNGGGGYDAELITLIKEMPRPVAVIIDAGCVSAGETLARDFARYAGARLFGQKTAGASSSKRTWTFPSGIASVVISTRSRWRNDGQPIEFNGIDPDWRIEPEPGEVAAGKNSEILRAEEYLVGLQRATSVPQKE